MDLLRSLAIGVTLVVSTTADEMGGAQLKEATVAP